VIVLGATLAACNLTDLARGQLAIVNEQAPLSRAIERERDPERKRMLQEVPAILAYAEDVMDMPAGHNYRGYFATESPGMTFVLTASEKARFAAYTWWFPITGEIEYRSYFTEAYVRQAQRELEAQGYDTFVSPSRSYSTLGFFRDPVSTTMLRSGLPGLVEVLLHELAHLRLFVPGQTEWNEALATFVGVRGATAYLSKSRFANTPYPAAWAARVTAQATLDALVARAGDELDALYASRLPREEKLARRQPIFDALSAEMARLFPERTPDELRVNNARLLHLRRYASQSDDVERLWQRSGGRWRMFWALAEAHAAGLP
jgi:predicted aminopeptidase